MAAPSIGDCISYGVDKLKSNPAYAIVGYFLVYLVGGCTVILQGPMTVGYFKGLAKSDKGEKAEIGDVFSGFENIAAGIVVGIIHLIGFILCFIPGLIITPAVMVAYRLIAEGEKDGMAAFKQGWAIAKPSLVGSLITIIVVGIVGGLGAILCGVGVFVTMPIAIAGIYLLTGGLMGAEAPAAAAPAADDTPAADDEEKTDG